MNFRTFRSFAVGLVLAACGGASQQSQQAVVLPQQPDGGAASNVAAMPPIDKSEEDAAVPISATDPVWGSRNAPVTIVEFTDFQCPFCSRVVPTIAQLKEAYGEQKLRIVFKNEPLSFHQNARPAAEAAATVHALGGNQAFWTFYDLAFQNQKDLGPTSYEAWAQKAGVSLPEFRDAMASHKYAAKVDADDALAQKLGANGTPHFFINGVDFTGAQPVDEFKKVIDAQLEAAKAELAKGVSAHDLYAVLAKENVGKRAQEDEGPVEDTKTVFKVPVGTSPVRGPKSAVVTIIEFADFQCPYCKRAEATLAQIKSTYPNDVRFVFKNEPLPFHQHAEPAAELALEARAEKGDAGFWAAHDKLFASEHLEDSDLEQIAKDLGLNVAKVKDAIAKKKYASVIDKDTDLAEDFQASGTPHFFIDGRRIVGAQPFDKFKPILDEEIAKAKALVTAGTKPEAVYDELTKNGKTPPPPEQKTITLTGTAPVRGPASATVTVVEFADFQCPYCKRALPTIEELLKAYPTKVKLEWRHMPLPFHQQAELAGEASVEAYKEKGSAGFWKMHDALYAHQSDPDGLSRASIDGYARGMGLDMTKFAHALDSGANASTVDADSKAATAAGLGGTPAFLVGRGNANGTWTAYLVSGAQPLSKFKKAVELALGAHP
ncbi:MAG TPA: thioredoxin domain-containing protein [Polyangiaceae bacterium]|jgi:protein-disulfide isomerase